MLMLIISTGGAYEGGLHSLSVFCHAHYNEDNGIKSFFIKVSDKELPIDGIAYACTNDFKCMIL